MYKQELQLMYEQESKTSAIQYRQARAEDVPEMSDLFLEAVSDLYARTNVTTALPPRPAVLVAYEHVRATGIFHVAELDGQIAAIAGAVVRDHLWYLSAFWARPDLQRQRIGMPLLRRVWNAGLEAGATIFFTWSSVDPTAMAAYMKLGMLPGYPILLFEGTPGQLPTTPSGYEVMDLEAPVAMAIDQDVRGSHRQADHSFWSNGSGVQGRQVLRNGRGVGYYYLGRGAIGPAAWQEPHEAEAVMTLACREAAEMSPEIRLSVPGINHVALRFAFDSGLRLRNFAHFLTTAPFGRMAQYLPSGPSLF